MSYSLLLQPFLLERSRKEDCARSRAIRPCVLRASARNQSLRGIAASREPKSASKAPQFDARIVPASGAKRATCWPTSRNCPSTVASPIRPCASKCVCCVFTAAANGVGQPRGAWTIERSAAMVEPAACQP